MFSCCKMVTYFSMHFSGYLSTFDMILDFNFFLQPASIKTPVKTIEICIPLGEFLQYLEIKTFANK